MISHKSLKSSKSRGSSAQEKLSEDKPAKPLVIEDTGAVYTFEAVMNKVHECPAHRSRYYQRALNKDKTVTLHRKVVFDSSMNKLIIVSANITFKQGVQRIDNPMILDNEIDYFTFKIQEPERNAATMMEV